MDVYNFPKLESPFVRKEINGRYVCTDELDERFSWIFTGSAIAVEKLDGSNLHLVVEEGRPSLYTRNGLSLEFLSKEGNRFANGIIKAVENNIFGNKELSCRGANNFYGELVGPDINEGAYGMDHYIWYPFKFLAENRAFKFWPKSIEAMNAGSSHEKYEFISDIFKGLRSLEKRKWMADKIKPQPVDENTVFGKAAEGNLACEGMVFYNNDHLDMSLEYALMIRGLFRNNAICKLRRDMFEWYKGKQHGV